MRLSDLPGCWAVTASGDVTPIKTNDTKRFIGKKPRMLFDGYRHVLIPDKTKFTKFIIWPKECFHEF